MIRGDSAPPAGNADGALFCATLSHEQAMHLSLWSLCRGMRVLFAILLRMVDKQNTVYGAPKPYTSAAGADERY